MELKPGYKQTEVGPIPEDWRASTLGEETDLLTGFPFPSSGYSQSGVRLVRGSNVKRGEMDWDESITEFWPQISGEIARYQLRQDDVVIAMDGALVGRSYAVIGNDDLPSILLQRVARIRSAKIEQRLIAAWIGSASFERHVDSVKTQTAIPHISPADIRSLKIATPQDRAEQSAIATALGDVDALLAAQDALIAKQRAIKQGAMQELLTGKRRLPGFNRAWEVKPLGEVLTVRHGKSQNEVEADFGEFPILATGGQIGWAKRWLYDKPSVLIGRKGTIDRPQYMETPFWTVDTLFYTQLNGDHVAKFFFYRFGLIDWMQYNEASGVPSLNARTIESIELACPPPEEQAAIAVVLSDIDAQLVTLEKKQDKIARLRQGVMQELLTGKTRLI